jgi:Zn-dependent protease with chaperone function
MANLLRCALWAFAALIAGVAHAALLTYEPVALGWSAEEVEHATIGSVQAIVQRAERSGQLGCRRHCERLARIFERLVAQAQTQSTRAQGLPWSLTVVQLGDVEAMAMGGGQIVISEAFIDRRAPNDEALAFVLAHEMAHSVLEHERQALTFARLLLPRHVPRTVQDMYTEMDFNIALLKAMEPVIQQGELEADELGLLLASVAGYAPDAQLRFIEHEAEQDTGVAPLVPPTRPRKCGWHNFVRACPGPGACFPPPQPRSAERGIGSRTHGLLPSSGRTPASRKTHPRCRHPVGTSAPTCRFPRTRAWLRGAPSIVQSRREACVSHLVWRGARCLAEHAVSPDFAVPEWPLVSPFVDGQGTRRLRKPLGIDFRQPVKLQRHEPHPTQDPLGQAGAGVFCLGHRRAACRMHRKCATGTRDEDCNHSIHPRRA